MNCNLPKMNLYQFPNSDGVALHISAMPTELDEVTIFHAHWTRALDASLALDVSLGRQPWTSARPWTSALDVSPVLDVSLGRQPWTSALGVNLALDVNLAWDIKSAKINGKCRFFVHVCSILLFFFVFFVLAICLGRQFWTSAWPWTSALDVSPALDVSLGRQPWTSTWPWTSTRPWTSALDVIAPFKARARTFKTLTSNYTNQTQKRETYVQYMSCSKVLFFTK